MLSGSGLLSTEQPHCCLKRYSCDCAATVSRVITMGQESLGSSAGIVTIQTTQPIQTSTHRPDQPGIPEYRPGTPEYGPETPKYGPETPEYGPETPEYGPETPDLGPPGSGPGV